MSNTTTPHTKEITAQVERAGLGLPTASVSSLLAEVADYCLTLDTLDNTRNKKPEHYSEAAALVSLAICQEAERLQDKASGYIWTTLKNTATDQALKLAGLGGLSGCLKALAVAGVSYSADPSAMVEVPEFRSVCLSQRGTKPETIAARISGYFQATKPLTSVNTEGQEFDRFDADGLTTQDSKTQGGASFREVSDYEQEEARRALFLSVPEEFRPLMLAIVEHGNLTAAGNALGMSKAERETAARRLSKLPGLRDRIVEVMS